VDLNRYHEAQQAYDAGDYRSAAKQFLASAGRGAEGNGLAYHKAGNSLVRLRRYQDAVTVYGHALRDPLYDKRGTVQANLGAAFVALGEYAEAAAAYENALAEPDYTARYKALQGLAGALLERGKIEEAAVNYRKAALDATNPDPGKALVNLGLCFMGLGRPADAVEAYKAALGFEHYKGRGRALANLGQAYTVLGQYEDATRSFEKAIQLHNHQLSPAATAAYETARSAAMAETETVEGWETGQLPVATEATGAPVAAMDGEQAAHELGFGDDAAVSEFFTMTEAQMLERDREVRRSARRTKRGGGVVRALIVVAVAALLFGACIGGGFALGFGWPTQRSTVSGLLSAQGQGGALAAYWVAAPGTDVMRQMRIVPPMRSFTVDGIVRGAQRSVVLVTVTPKTGAPLHYRITLSREGVGWKVSGIENDWSSTTGG
jgi:tetratricopeptide (TPR) repeat protein